MNTTFLAPCGDGIARAERISEGTWRVSHQARGRSVACLAAHPAHPTRLYAGTRDGVLCSEDGGSTWFPRGMAGQIVKSLAVSPHNPNIVYAGTKPAALFRSDDGGASWRELDGFRRIPNRWWWFSPAEPPDPRPYVFAITLSPTEPDVLLAGVEFGAVVRSEDGGKTWSRHLPGALRDCHTLTFHHVNGDWVYEAGGGGVRFSQDGGRTFQKTNRGLAGRYGIACAADPLKPEVWYACVGHSPWNAFGKHSRAYLYRAIGGAGWQPIGWLPHPLPETPTTLVTLPNVPGSLYAGLQNGDIWFSPDYGDSWEKLPFNLGRIWFSLLIL